MLHRPEDKLDVRICAPGKIALEQEAVELTVPGGDGIFTVMPNHTPFLSTLIPGVLVVYLPQGEKRYFALNRGFVEVNGNRVVVLTDTVEWGPDINLGRAQSAKERAEQRLRTREADIDNARAEAALMRAVARINAHGADED